MYSIGDMVRYTGYDYRDIYNRIGEVLDTKHAPLAGEVSGVLYNQTKVHYPEGDFWISNTDLSFERRGNRPAQPVIPIKDIAHADYDVIAKEVAGVVKEKNAAYGNSVSKVTDVLKILYPSGVSPEQYDDLLFVTRVLDKIGRITQGKADSLGEDAFVDILGYSLLQISKRRKK